MRVGRVTLSDRASSGIYEDLSGPEIERILRELLAEPIEFERLLLPDEQLQISSALKGLCDEGCVLIVTTGGTGPAIRDVTPEATRAILDHARTLIFKGPDGDFIAWDGWCAGKDFDRESSGVTSRHCGVSAASDACNRRGDRSYRWISSEVKVSCKQRCNDSFIRAKNSAGEDLRSQASAPLQ